MARSHLSGDELLQIVSHCIDDAAHFNHRANRLFQLQMVDAPHLQLWVLAQQAVGEPVVGLLAEYGLLRHEHALDSLIRRARLVAISVIGMAEFARRRLGHRQFAGVAVNEDVVASAGGGDKAARLDGDGMQGGVRDGGRVGQQGRQAGRGRRRQRWLRGAVLLCAVGRGRVAY
eukprot:6212189-Pleurochrysis_carterae.AAC.9